MDLAILSKVKDYQIVLALNEVVINITKLIDGRSIRVILKAKLNLSGIIVYTIFRKVV